MSFEHTAICFCRTCREAWFDESEGDFCEDQGHDVVWADTERTADEVSLLLIGELDRGKATERDLASVLAYLRQADTHLVSGNVAEGRRILHALRTMATDRRHLPEGQMSWRIGEALSARAEVAS